MHLPRDPRAPGIARGTLRLILAAHDLGGRLRVAVWDTDPRIPPAFSADVDKDAVPPPDTEGGRGLHLVRACADEVGVSVLRELGASKGGKLLWADCGRGVAW
ncbi:ATP-binding protein [Streptomyces sp. NPDC005820]|uniref:ATP-binding protein n=1 Tax=Streptomyces sp. NPDC005820 TaxID=3157069 RepID=UPI0033D4CAE8